MKAKNENKIVSKGTGAGSAWIEFKSASAERLVEFAPRAWSPSRKAWAPVAILRGARGAVVSAPRFELNPAEAGAVRSFVLSSQAVHELEFRSAPLTSQGVDEWRARAGAALVEVNRLFAWAESLGVEVERSACDGRGVLRRAVAFVSPAECLALDLAKRARAEAEAERAEARACKLSLVMRKRRALRSAAEAGAIHPAGSVRAQYVRWWKVAGVALPSSAPALDIVQARVHRLTVPAGSWEGRKFLFGGNGNSLVPLYKVTRAGVRINRHHKRRDLSAALKSLGASSSVLPAFIAERAERGGRRWVRGSSAKSARDKSETVGKSGGKRAADDCLAYAVRLEQEIGGIYRGEALGALGRGLRAFESSGLRVNRRMRLAIAGDAPVFRVDFVFPLRWDVFARSLLCGGAPALLIAQIVALSVRVRRPVRFNPAISSACKKAAEAWEYAAIRQRDGREVGGDFSLQGAIHGLRDFAFAESAPADSSEAPADDFGADEWSAQVDAASARLASAKSEAERAEWQAAGFSAEHAERLASAPEAEAEAEAGGRLSFAPDAGAGSGFPSWVAESIAQAAERARAEFAERLASAKSGSARAKIKASGGRELALVESLAEFVAGRGRLSAEALAYWLPSGGGGALSEAERQKFSRLRKRLGIERQSGREPAQAVVAVHSPAEAHRLRQAGLSELVRRPAPRLSSVAGDEVASAPVPFRKLFQDMSGAEAERLRIVMQWQEQTRPSVQA